jgi:hypothetical protein
MTPQPPKPAPNTYWVIAGKLLAGEYPGARDPEEARSRLRKFLAAGVRHFVDLTEAGELEPYAELLIEEAGSRTSYERFPIRDGSVPGEPKTMGEITVTIDRAMAEEGTHLHSLLGWRRADRTRRGMLVAGARADTR